MSAPEVIRSVRRLTILCVVILFLTGCISEEQAIRERAKVVQACVDSGGEWYSTPGWGSSCHFDTRGQ